MPIPAMLLALAVGAGARQVPPVSAPSPNRCADDAGWNEPAVPRRLYGNTWYVGTCGITALLVTSKQGHVLVDAGTAEAAPQVEANIRRLGFRLRDIRAIVGSHAHDDHAGGLARLQRDSGAPVYALAPAMAVLASGRAEPGDPQFGTFRAFPAVARLRRIDDRGHVRVGPIDLTAHATPGHTPGSTSWTWRECENGRCLDIAYADSLTAISDDTYRFSDDAKHPGVVSTFRRTLGTVASLPCDILVTPHPSASALWSRMAPAKEKPLVDGTACRAYADGARLRLEQRLAKEAATP